MSKHDKREKKLVRGKILLPLLTFLIFLCLWAVVVLKNYFSYSRFAMAPSLGDIFSISLSRDAPGLLSAMIVHLVNIMFGAAMFGAAAGWGELLFGKLLPEKKCSFFYTIGLGFGVLIMFFLAIGYAGLLYPALLHLFIIGGLIFFFLKRKNFLLPAISVPNYYLAVLACIVFVSLSGALTPATYYDSLVYHLSVPQFWLFANRIEPIKYVYTSYYPLNMELLFGYALATTDYTASAKIINLIFFFLTLAAIYTFTLDLTKDKNTACVASLIYGTTPFVLLQTWRTGNELGQAFWELLALGAVLKWFDDKSEKKWIALAGIFLGLALGTKHSATMTLLCFSVAFIFSQKMKMGCILKKYALFLVFALGVSAPWYLTTFIRTGNPIYPQFAGKISAFRGTLRAKTADFPTPLATAFPPVTNIKKILTAPWNVTMGKIESGHTGPFYLLLMPLFFFYKKPTEKQKFLMLYVLGYTLLWLTVGGQYFRRFIPALPAVSMILAVHLLFFTETFKIKWPLTVLTVFLMLLSLRLTLFFLKVSQDPWGYLTGRQSRISFLNRPRATYPKLGARLFEWANEHLPPDAVVLFLSEHRPLYLERAFVWHEVHDQNPVVEWCNNLKDPEKVFDKIREKGITHIFFSLSEHMRLSIPYNLYYFSKQGRQTFKQFWDNHIRLVHTLDHSVIYIVLPAEEAASHPVPHNYILNPPKK